MKGIYAVTVVEITAYLVPRCGRSELNLQEADTAIPS